MPDSRILYSHVFPWASPQVGSDVIFATATIMLPPVTVSPNAYLAFSLPMGNANGFSLTLVPTGGAGVGPNSMGVDNMPALPFGYVATGWFIAPSLAAGGTFYITTNNFAEANTGCLHVVVVDFPEPHQVMLSFSNTTSESPPVYTRGVTSFTGDPAYKELGIAFWGSFGRTVIGSVSGVSETWTLLEQGVSDSVGYGGTGSAAAYCSDPANGAGTTEPQVVWTLDTTTYGAPLDYSWPVLRFYVVPPPPPPPGSEPPSPSDCVSEPQLIQVGSTHTAPTAGATGSLTVPVGVVAGDLLLAQLITVDDRDPGTTYLSQRPATPVGWTSQQYTYDYGYHVEVITRLAQDGDAGTVWSWTTPTAGTVAAGYAGSPIVAAYVWAIRNMYQPWESSVEIVDWTHVRNNATFTLGVGTDMLSQEVHFEVIGSIRVGAFTTSAVTTNGLVATEDAHDTYTGSTISIDLRQRRLSHTKEGYRIPAGSRTNEVWTASQAVNWNPMYVVIIPPAPSAANLYIPSGGPYTLWNIRPGYDTWDGGMIRLDGPGPNLSFLDTSLTYSGDSGYDLRNATLTIEPIPVDGPPYKRMNLHLFEMTFTEDGDRLLGLDGSGNLRVKAAGVIVSTPITYDPVAHRYWQVAGDGTTMYYRVSPDRINWTTLYQEPITANPYHAMEISLAAYESAGPPTYAELFGSTWDIALIQGDCGLLPPAPPSTRLVYGAVIG